MELQWYGQSAFRLSDGERTVFIDPFDDMSPIASRGMQWDYPAIEGVSADLLLVTHEHFHHNRPAAPPPRALRPNRRPRDRRRPGRPAAGGHARVAGRGGRRHRRGAR